MNYDLVRMTTDQSLFSNAAANRVAYLAFDFGWKETANGVMALAKMADEVTGVWRLVEMVTVGNVEIDVPVSEAAAEDESEAWVRRPRRRD